MNILNKYFEHIYVINLEKDLERKNYIEKLFNKYNINFEFINAIDGNNLDTNTLKLLELWAYPGNKFCNKECSCSGKGHELSDAQIGCALSHYLCYKDIVKNKYKTALIFEDDIKFESNFENIIKNIFEKELPNNWELIHLSYTTNHIKNCISYSDNLYKRISGGISGVHFYGISLDTAKILENNFYPIRAASDGYISHFIINNKLINNVFTCKTRLGKNLSTTKFKSNILQ